MPGRERNKKRTMEDVWGAVADRLGGERRLDRKGRRLKDIRFVAGEWELVLDRHVQSNGQTSQTYTRLRSLFTQRRPLKFRAYTKSIFSDIGKALGMQDIEVGHPRVDPGWIIKGDGEGEIRSLMILPQVVEGLARLKSARFEIRRHKRSMPDVQVLQLQVLGVMTDESKLEAAVALMFAAMAHLVRAGIAAPEPPEVTP